MTELLHVRFSEVEGAGQQLRAQANDMEALLQRLQTASNDLLGYGLGGYMASQFSNKVDELFQTASQMQAESQYKGIGLVWLAHTVREFDESVALVFGEESARTTGINSYSGGGGGGGSSGDSTEGLEEPHINIPKLMMGGTNLLLRVLNIPGQRSISEVLLKELGQQMPVIADLMSTAVGKVVGKGVIGGFLDWAVSGDYSTGALAGKLGAGVTLAAAPEVAIIDTALKVSGNVAGWTLNQFSDELGGGNMEFTRMYQDQAQDLIETAEAASPKAFIESVFRGVWDTVTGQTSAGNAISNVANSYLEWGQGMAGLSHEVNTATMLLGSRFGLERANEFMDLIGVDEGLQSAFNIGALRVLHLSVDTENIVDFAVTGAFDIYNELAF